MKDNKTSAKNIKNILIFIQKKKDLPAKILSKVHKTLYYRQFKNVIISSNDASKKLIPLYM